MNYQNRTASQPRFDRHGSTSPKAGPRDQEQGTLTGGPSSAEMLPLSVLWNDKATAYHRISLKISLRIATSAYAVLLQILTNNSNLNHFVLEICFIKIDLCQFIRPLFALVTTAYG